MVFSGIFHRMDVTTIFQSPLFSACTQNFSTPKNYLTKLSSKDEPKHSKFRIYDQFNDLEDLDLGWRSIDDFTV